MKKKILIIFGTRPEFLKLYPIIVELKRLNKKFDILNTGQHFELIRDQRVLLRKMKYKNLNLMKKAKNISKLFTVIHDKVSNYLIKTKPAIVIVQGDTTTAVASALAASHNQIKIAHIEAGLRTFDKKNPYPEEINRLLISKISDYHFAPTKLAYKNLIRENINKKNIYITGNTIVDLIRQNKDKIKNNKNNIVLCTIHRRENFGINFKIICMNIKNLAKKFPNLNFIFVAHPNKNIKNYAPIHLGKLKNLRIIKPLSFIETLNYIVSSTAIITDSGGIQEEATTLNKYCLVVRKITERVESVKSGNCYLTGLKKKNFLKFIHLILRKKNNILNTKILIKKTFGDGYASQKIIKVLNQYG
jgi:UDP-N-acetylglucosamine 2-epimerase (non-hydrolysing)